MKIPTLGNVGMLIPFLKSDLTYLTPIWRYGQTPHFVFFFKSDFIASTGLITSPDSCYLFSFDPKGLMKCKSAFFIFLKNPKNRKGGPLAFFSEIFPEVQRTFLSELDENSYTG